MGAPNVFLIALTKLVLSLIFCCKAMHSLLFNLLANIRNISACNKPSSTFNFFLKISSVLFELLGLKQSGLDCLLHLGDCLGNGIGGGAFLVLTDVKPGIKFFIMCPC